MISLLNETLRENNIVTNLFLFGSVYIIGQATSPAIQLDHVTGILGLKHSKPAIEKTDSYSSLIPIAYNTKEIQQFYQSSISNLHSLIGAKLEINNGTGKPYTSNDEEQKKRLIISQLTQPVIPNKELYFEPTDKIEEDESNKDLIGRVSDLIDNLSNTDFGKAQFGKDIDDSTLIQLHSKKYDWSISDSETFDEYRVLYEALQDIDHDILDLRNDVAECDEKLKELRQDYNQLVSKKIDEPHFPALVRENTKQQNFLLATQVGKGIQMHELESNYDLLNDEMDGIAKSIASEIISNV